MAGVRRQSWRLACTCMCLWALLGCASPSTPLPAPHMKPSNTSSKPAVLYNVPLPPTTQMPESMATSASPNAAQVPDTTTVAEPAGNSQVTILHTNDSRGYVDPCG